MEDGMLFSKVEVKIEDIISDINAEPKICMFCPSKIFSSVDTIIQFKDNIWKSCEYCNLISDKLFIKISEQQNNKFFCDHCAVNNLEFDELCVHMKDHLSNQPCVCPGENQNKVNIDLGSNEGNILTVNGCIFENEDMLTTFKQEVETCLDENPPVEQSSNSQQTDKGDFNSQIKVKLSENLFQCKICIFKTESQSTFIKHMNILSQKKPFKCDQCQFIHCKKGKLTQHIKFVHTLEKQLYCEFCEYKCFHDSALKIHMMIHTGEKPFVCNICQFKTSGKGNLNRHILRKHSLEKPHKCDQCEYKSSDSSYLKLHMRVHSSQPFYCHHCEFNTFYKSVFTKHIRKKHNEEKLYISKRDILE